MTTTNAHDTSSPHVVHLYDDVSADLAGNVSGFLGAAFAQGGSAIVIATPEHRHVFAAALTDAGTDVAAAVDAGDLTLVDARATLDGFMVGDHPDPHRFDEVVGGLVRATRRADRPLRAYGEMVAVLWEQGSVAAAIELEDLWNRLLAREELSLMCAYPTELVGEGAAHVCEQHSEVVAGRTFERGVHAPRAARLFVRWALESWGRPDVEASMAVIVSELATNAIRHAASSFSVTVTMGAGVRVAVRDTSPSSPQRRHAADLAESGRGLQLVGELATSWGTELDGGGKVVWAEIAG